ncbi:MAG: SPOR domain-containing protein [Deltaproteobacteria bacterium]|nr:MAG: SPOR domain-containing protein [Deltaproteobacteria bacterium]
MSSGRRSKGRKKVLRFELSKLALAGWCFGLLVALLWMFVLGVFVGKGITPANINLAEIKKRMVDEGVWPGSGKAVQQEESTRTTNTKRKIPLNDLEFYEKLAQKKKARLQEFTPEKTAVKDEPAAAEVQPKPADTTQTQPKPDGATQAQPPSGAQKTTEVSKEEKPSRGSFTVQLASFKDQNSAKKFAAQFQDLKPKPFVRTVDLPGKGRWYRVQVGQLSSRDEADALADRLAKKYQLKAFVISLDG